MGTFRTTGRIRNIGQREQSVELSSLLVDTGSEYTWGPGALLDSIGVAREKKGSQFVMANGSIITRSVGFAIVDFAGTFTVDEVVFGEPGDQVLLGARSLSGLNLAVERSDDIVVSIDAVLAT